jgi:hypothetical protein
MDEKEYLVKNQMLYIDEHHYQMIMEKNTFFTMFPGPPRWPATIWGRLAKLRPPTQVSPERFRVVVPLYEKQNLRRTRRRMSVKIFMVDSRTDIAYNPRSPYFAGAGVDA